MKGKFDKRIYIILPFLVLAIISVWARTAILKLKNNDSEIIVVSPYNSINLEAKSAYVYDLKTNEALYSKNEEMQWPLASVSKLMTAIVAEENAPEGLSIKTPETLLPERGGGDIRTSEWWNLKELIDFSLVASSNDGALAIASAVGAIDMKVDQTPEESFVAKMNNKARELGMTQTYFINSYGLDVSENFAGSYGSAKDISALLSYAYKNHEEMLESTAKPELEVESISGIKHNVRNTNGITGKLSGLVASKTGFTDLSGGNLAIIFEAGPAHPIAIVVLGSSKDERFEDVQKLYKASLFDIKLKSL